MRRIIGIGICLFIVCLGSLALAVDKPVLAWIENIQAKPGTEAQFEAALQKHYAWHAAQNDTWPIYVWVIINGDRAGQYLIGTFNSTWQDYDAREAFEMADMKEAVATLGPYVDKYTSFIMGYEEELSRPPDVPGPAKFCQLTRYYVKAKSAPAFYDAVKEIKAALDAAGFPVHNRWYALVSGGEVPCWVNATDRSSWSDFAGPEKSLRKTLEEKLGGRKATELLGAVAGACDRIVTEIVVYRPDLGYIPVKK
jgi:hypothetical protein